MTFLLRVAVAAILAVAVSGCGASSACYDTTDHECEAGTRDAEDVLPPGFVTLTVGAGVGFSVTPVVACYPDGSAIWLELVTRDGEIGTQPYSGQVGWPDDSCD
jgi:hypothetical protein